MTAVLANAASALVDDAAARVPPAGAWRPVWRKLRRRRSAMIGLVVVALFVGAALFAPWLAPFDPIETSWSAIRKAPSAAHWFGTDDIGRDVLSRIIWGTRASLLAGVVAVSIAVALGVPIGMTAGLVGGFVDALISRLTDAFLACPFLILAIALAAFLGPNLTNAMIAIGLEVRRRSSAWIMERILIRRSRARARPSRGGR